jgi:hypothetical protein
MEPLSRRPTQFKNYSIRGVLGLVGVWLGDLVCSGAGLGSPSVCGLVGYCVAVGLEERTQLHDMIVSFIFEGFRAHAFQA